MDPQQGPSPPDLLIGQTIGNYLVTQKLGEGGMGSVYLAEHPSIGKKVALKVLHSEFSTNQEVAARFFNEAKAVNDIGHPNIVDIVDFGILQAGPNREQLVYFIMEYLAGLTLAQLIRAEAPLAPERALSIAVQVGDALAASHRCNIVHRDLKPDNIILLQRGRERDFVKLLDFGIAKLTSDRPGSSRTRTGIVMGTPAYMSPEQCEGRGNTDHRTDIYALGIVCYEMLVGRVPFIGEGYGEILVQHLTQPPVPLSQYRMMNPHLEAVVMKALEKRADNRYPTMDEMMRAMTDPVGYVEAHGGVTGFGQRQLMPSSGPIPHVRLTPPPMPTPPPGTLMPMGIATPVPTTLGGSAGQAQGQGSSGKKSFMILASLVVAAAVAAIVVVLSQDQVKKVESAGEGGSDQGSQVASGSDGSAGSAAPDQGSNRVVDLGSAQQGSSTAAGSGSSAGGGSAGSGSAGFTPTVPERTTVTLTLVTRPPGVRIFVDGEEQAVRTPEPFKVPRGKPVKIVLRSAGYDDIALPVLDLTEDRMSEHTMKPRRRVITPPVDPKKGSGNKGSGGGAGSDDSGLMPP